MEDDAVDATLEALWAAELSAAEAAGWRSGLVRAYRVLFYLYGGLDVICVVGYKYKSES